jgi:hypothetical protein
VDRTRPGRALAALPDGHLIFGSETAPSLWNPARGAKTASLEGYAGGVQALAVVFLR